MKLLALDISSTNIGYVVWDGSRVGAFGTLALKSTNLLTRLTMAHPLIESLIDRTNPDAIAYEGPAHKTYALAMIAQQRMVGVILLTVGMRHLPLIEIAPAAAKKALTRKGNANKDTMQLYASAYTDLPFDEHQADALGVALAAWDTLTQKRRAA